MKTLFAFLLLCSVAVAAKDTPLKPVRIREVSLQKVPLKEGERIASIEVEVAGASFSSVHIPIDWSFEAGAPVSGVAVLKGEAAHGVGMPFTADEFQRFVTLAFYDHGFPQREFSIKVKLGLYLYDPKKKSESERVIELSSDSIVLKEPNQAPEPTAPSGRGSS
jgi:hypothetical protein